MDKNVIKLEFKAGNNEKCVIKEIRNSAVYIQKSELSHLLELYYLIDWKGYPEEKNR